jgi:hypothetical protein
MRRLGRPGVRGLGRDHRVLLEAANFEPIGILKTSERLGLRTAGSNRWEKGVDPYLAEPAAMLASRLIVDLAGARLTGHAHAHRGLGQCSGMSPEVRCQDETTRSWSSAFRRPSARLRRTGERRVDAD